MKIYNRVEIDIKTGEILYEDSYGYIGAIVRLKGGGGGSTAGTISYPTFVEDAWKDYWGFVGSDPDDPAVTMVDAISASLTTSGGNPYASETSFDPAALPTLASNSPLDKMEDAQEAYELKMLALDAELDWSGMIDNATVDIDADFTEGDTDVDTKIASVVTTALANAGTLITDAVASAVTIMASATITSEIDAYELDRLPEHMRAIGRAAASFADFNSVSGSGFVFALANMESRYQHEINQYGIKIKREILDGSVRSYVTTFIEKVRTHARAYIQNRMSYVNNRANMVIQGTQQMVSLLTNENDHLRAAYAMQIEVSRMVIIALKEQNDRQLEIDMGDARWDIDMLGTGANMFGQLAGGVGGTQPPPVSPVQSAIGGALSGAATGAMVGSIVPGIGTAAGAIIGGIGGLLAGIF